MENFEEKDVIEIIMHNKFNNQKDSISIDQLMKKLAVEEVRYWDRNYMTGTRKKNGHMVFADVELVFVDTIHTTYNIILNPAQKEQPSNGAGNTSGCSFKH